MKIKDKILSETSEEVKQRVRDTANKLVMKQETLEEAAERMYREYPTNPIDKPEWNYNRDINCFRKRKAFINGAKWQQERSYSEEEVLNIIQLFNDDFNMIHDTVPKWFEQFKKK